MGYKDKFESEDKISDDTPRIDYLRQHMEKVAKAIEAAIPVNGYFVWSLQDMFSWTNGYSKRYVFCPNCGKEFDIKDNPQKRIIHLYDIPLSAGLGEDILDSDIPFVEYETDIEDGDFALHVSGDSMEPEIPDGSIGFVKKQSEIADGISGAFFLNGEVYCKKLLHKDGEVFLCSNNAKYKPIEIHDGDTLIVYGKIVKVLC